MKSSLHLLWILPFRTICLHLLQLYIMTIRKWLQEALDAINRVLGMENSHDLSADLRQKSQIVAMDSFFSLLLELIIISGCKT